MRHTKMVSNLLTRTFSAMVILTMLMSAVGVGTANAAPAGTALQFNGSTQYVDWGTALGLGVKSFTLESWIKRTGTGVSANTGSAPSCTAVPLITKGMHEADGSNVDANYFLGIDGSNHLCADFEDYNNGTNHPITGTNGQRESGIFTLMATLITP